MKHKSLAILICLMAAQIASAQNTGDHSLVVMASLPSRMVQNINDLKLKILIKNSGDNRIKVYKLLIEGYAQDPFANLNLVVEREGKNGFHSYSRGSLYQMVPVEDTIDVIDKVELNSKDSIVHFFHLDDAYLFLPGSYRTKCIYKNDIKQSDRIFTPWVYFRVKKTIPISHHYNN